jgi:hypothetical protein
MIKTHVLTPAVFVMTALALPALLALVYIIGPVTTETVGLELVISRIPLVTLPASGLGVFALERKPRIPVMVETYRGPATGGMTTATTFAVATVMFIIELVTAIAISSQFLLIQCALVTGLAFGALVSASKTIAGVPVMIKADHVPTFYCMTVMTLVTKATVVLIVQLMTGITIPGCVLVLLVDMAAVTVHVHVFAFERKLGLAMIITGLPP